MDDSPMARHSDVQPMLLDLDTAPQPPPPQQQNQPNWEERLLRALAYQDSNVAELAEEAVRALPGDPEVLLLSATAMLLANQPDRALTFVKRHQKRFVPGRKSITLLTALAYARAAADEPSQGDAGGGEPRPGGRCLAAFPRPARPVRLVQRAAAGNPPARDTGAAAPALPGRQAGESRQTGQASQVGAAGNREARSAARTDRVRPAATRSAVRHQRRFRQSRLDSPLRRRRFSALVPAARRS